MSNEQFNGTILAEKLSKLNNSQQSIESLSRWCISNRKKAKLIVETWDKLFNSSQREQRVSFLYLANDILQNSRRKGSEFVTEFWKVLPASLKLIYDNGDEFGMKVATRLVGIWEERKVFGSRGQSLKDVMIGKNPPPLLLSSVKTPNPIKIVKRDAQSVRIKLVVGGLPEKILTAFHSVLDENEKEEVALSKCDAAVSHVCKIGEDIENAPNQAAGNHPDFALVDEIQEQENVLHQCLEQLERAETIRAALVSQLKEALEDQESKLDFIRSQLQVARGQFEQAGSMRKRVTPSMLPEQSTTNSGPPLETMKMLDHSMPSVQANSNPATTQPAVSYTTTLRPADEDSKKAAAAAVAAKLTASSSSAQMLTSVLSSLVAEEAAAGFTGLPFFSSGKRQKLESPSAVPDFSPLQQQSATNQVQTSYAAPPPLPPPPNQYVQSATGMVMMPYGYGGNILPPPPPLPPPHIAMGGMQRPSQQQQGQPQLQQVQEQQSPPVNGGYYRPQGIGFYGQSHQQPTTPAVPRQ